MLRPKAATSLLRCNIGRQFALLETARSHSKVANTLTMGHPTGASSPAPISPDGPHYKGTTFMTSKLLLAAFSASLLLGAAHGAMAADAKPAPIKITPAVLKALQAAQTANNKKDYPAAIAAIQQAEAVPDRTPT